MRRTLFILSLLGVIAAVGLVPRAAQALAPSEVKISGVVTDHGRPVAGVSVLGDCGHFAKYADPTDTHGVYVIVFTVDQCPIGDQVRVFAFPPDDQKRGEGVAIAQPLTRIDIALVPVSSVPEYGWVAGTFAAVTGFGTMAFVRRRNARLNKGSRIKT